MLCGNVRNHSTTDSSLDMRHKTTLDFPDCLTPVACILVNSLVDRTGLKRDIERKLGVTA